ncbi:MAG: hypothetical protein IAE82_05955 [Opitutaceae bacterium]|nr:hypothetical protein [Opitutaceae bacterium]
MHWRQKALVQNLVARLPDGPSQACCYALHKETVSFRSPQVATVLKAAIAFLGQIHNRYMQTNRLRADDHPIVYAEAGQHNLATESTQDPDLIEQLSRDSFRLAERFRQKSHDCLITTTSWFISRPESSNSSPV